MSPSPDIEETSCSPRFLPAGIGDTEDLERYEPGGFHPVHLGDEYDGGRYKVIHKLGAGGFSTVWLAQDLMRRHWVALKIILADESPSVETKTILSHRVASQCSSDAVFVTYSRYFHIEGPNGRHLCLVLPVLGPSASRLSQYMDSRIEPWLARRASYQTAKALAGLTTANIVFRVENFDRYTENDIYRLFGKPETGPLETESGETPGAEAPRYIVKSLDFLSSETDLISNEISLIDFDQAFLASSPPEEMLATPIEYLAPEVAVGRAASPASDVWALGCSIVRLRSGEGLFSAFDITSPADLIRGIIQALSDMPASWEDSLFDSDGQPTKDLAKGEAVWKFTDKRPFKDQIYRIWDNPSNLSSKSTKSLMVNHIENVDQTLDWESHKPYPRCFSHKFWKPTAVEVGDAYLHGYDNESDNLLAPLPKISDHEAALLYDLLSQIFVYEPIERVKEKELLDHPWFHMDDSNRVWTRGVKKNITQESGTMSKRSKS
ncbi:hypothetical protein ONS95_002870 [Cadophora gregata]|uniref:uncharacterized protein n=1 Tax=Cadophora gregata TaxID=51156 RepID=UPI0026DA6F5E|nr:uncharacterized protein ONS95_002870 [Cadophora gregata]KAK0108045.1 hypothetical protein ONS95_002870 [Cadophora gregata]